MFKKKRKAIISIESEDNNVNINIAWDKNNNDQIILLVKVLTLLKYGDLEGHINKAIKNYGSMTNDMDTANEILSSMQSIDSNIGKKNAEIKYLSKLLSGNERNPIIAPDEVLNIFKNSIG